MSVRRALLLPLVAASLACAQEPSNDDLKRENEALKRKVAELETQIEVSSDLGYINQATRERLLEQLDHESRMLRNLIKRL